MVDLGSSDPIPRATFGMLNGMADGTTTMKLSVRNRDVLRRIADEDGLTLDEALGRVLRRERQRRIGQQLSAGLTAEERTLARGGTHAVGTLLTSEDARAGG